MKREPKLRPSMSWAEISLTVAALESCIATAVQSKQVTKQIMGMVKVKEYLETFKPVDAVKSEAEQLAFFMKKFGLVASGKPDDSIAVLQTELVSNEPLTSLPDTPLDKTPLTDDERYDMLKLMGESSYTEDDIMFMNNVGFLIMMRRASKTPVDAKDL